MKTILVPLDYSENSLNALEYAAHLADDLKAKIVLLHIFELPVSSTEMPVITVTPGELEEIHNSKMKEIADKIHQQHTIEIKWECIPGYSVEEIIRKIKSIDADLTVMGIRGVNLISELLIGSVATGVARNAEHAVLIIPENAKFNAPKKILFASDNMAVANNKTFNILHTIANQYQSEIAIVNVSNNTKNEIKLMDFSNHLKEIKFNHHIITGDDISSAINDFNNTFHADILVNIPRQHSFFDKITHESNTKKFAFHTPIPLLTLPSFE